jgi:hypothetical protein
MCAMPFWLSFKSFSPGCLIKVDAAIGHAVSFGVQQDALMAVSLADHKQLAPKMSLQHRKAIARGYYDFDDIKSVLQIVELPANCGVNLTAAWLLLLGNIEELSTC